LGVADEPLSAGSVAERSWLLAYAVASQVYRVVITVAIVLYIAGKLFVVGVALAIWAAIAQFLLPVGKGLRFLLTDARLQGSRARALTVTVTIVGALAALLFLAPFPLWTRAEGVVWAPERAEVRAGADGILVSVLAPPNSRVQPGDPLLQLEAPTLKVRVSAGEADLQEITARYNAVRMTKQIEADNLREQMVAIEADLARARERLEGLTVRSGASGVFVVERPSDLVGRYVHQGDLVGLVVDDSKATVRVAVSQADIGLIRRRTEAVGVRLAGDLPRRVPATVRRAVPSASERLVSAALGSVGGGRFAVDPGDEHGTRTLEKLFDIELELAEPASRLGGRAYVRFEHGTEPLGLQWYRRLRQLFLGRFDV
jgi:putative peptide zinc metalloprotease protein